MRNRIILSLLSICLFLGSANAATKSKKIEKTFKAGESVKIESKYGKIQIKHWDKAEVGFAIEISANGSDDEKSQTMLDNISIDFTEGETQLYAKTIFGDFFSLKKLTNSLFNKGEISINYTVQMPNTTQLEIVQKNGSVFMDNHQASVKIDLDNGNFTAQDLNGENNLKFVGATVKIENLGNSGLDAANSKISIENAAKLTGESRDSEFAIHSIDNLNIKSARDKFDIKEVEYLYGTSTLSKFEVSQVGSEIDFDLKLGHLNVFNINNLFSFVKIDSKYGDVGLSFMEGCQMDYEINHKSVKFDNSNFFTLSNQATADKNTFVAKGKIGEKKAISKLSIRANNCKIRLQ